ncbi:hypothetical protein B0T16DRAFT_296178, partial [Cercophora newfieldiana]
GKLSSFAGSNTNTQHQTQQQEPSASGGAGGLFDKLHGAVGGGPESEKKEDALDKGASRPPHKNAPTSSHPPTTLKPKTKPFPHSGIDWVQENVLKQGNQNNESAAEQAKDKLIAETIRDQYTKATGKEFPVKEK